MNRRAAFLSRAIQECDIAIVIFALIIAELIGLNTKCLEFKAFGTVKDYVDLFVWGAGTKATLDIVTGTARPGFFLTLSTATALLTLPSHHNVPVSEALFG
jgi:hypothetical protein